MKKVFLLLTAAMLIMACSTEVVQVDPINMEQDVSYSLQQVEEDLMIPPKLNQTPIDPKWEAEDAFKNANRTAQKGAAVSSSHVLWEQLIQSNWVLGFGRHINLVFVAEGFTEAEMPLFDALVESLSVYMDGGDIVRNAMSYSHNGGGAWDVYSYRTVSNESGISVEGGAQVDTYWNIYRNAGGLARLTAIDAADKTRFTDAVLKNPSGYLKGEEVYPIFIVNTGTYAGSGEFEGVNGKNNISRVPYTIATKDSEFGYFLQLAFHEFMHSFGNFDDEYVDANYAAVGWSPRGNVTNDTINDRKWSVSATGQEMGYGTGYFQGARYNNEFYRPIPNSMMRALNGGWAGVHAWQVLHRRDCALGYNSSSYDCKDTF